MKINNIEKTISVAGLTLTLILFGCRQSKYLQAPSTQAQVVPSTLADYQALLDRDTYMNGSTLAGLIPDFEEAGTDDYFADSLLDQITPSFGNLYTWNDNIYGYPFADWDFLYRCVFYANEVLDGLNGLSVDNTQIQEWMNVKGSALFYRSYAFYHIAQVFAPQYDSGSAATDWGIPLRLSSDLNEAIVRSTVQATYDRILEDLKESISYLPTTGLYLTRPGKAAAYALLSKVYLSMMNYSQARLYADSSLQINNALLDYNTIDTSGGYSVFPFPRFNAEVLLHSVQIENTMLTFSIAMVDSSLFKMYDSTDLRKVLFFGYQDGLGYSFRGSYDNSYELFTGLTTAEEYLIRAEGAARMGDANAAMADVNTLLGNRYIRNSFTPLTASSAADALVKVLAERRKELVFRGCRWMDLRRLNKTGSNITINRLFQGQTYTIAPNSDHYTYLIPPDVIGFNPQMPQNPR
jgi:tetratricopeptide (TPR) repeat protein